jgi:hypothetical protein
MVVDGDEEEEGAHVYPITCAELLSGEIGTLYVATQFLTHVLIKFQKKTKIAKKTMKTQKMHF